MSRNNQYGTMLAAIEDLSKRGYTENFRLENDTLLGDNGKAFKPSELEVTEYHRFEGMTNPSDMSIVYAIKTDSDEKGTLVDAYGTNASADIAFFMKQVKQIAD